MISKLLVVKMLSYSMTILEIQTILLHKYNCLATPKLISIIIESLLIEDRELKDVKQYPEQFYESY